MPSSKQSRISALPEDLREQLRRRLAGQATQSDTIPPAERTGQLPLSFSQQRLWFLNEFQPSGSDYNSALALRLSGPLDVPALTEAVQSLCVRHESLRTTFDEVDGKPVQLVHPDGVVPVPVVELTGDLDEVLREEYARPFDLRRGPLFRALLVRLTPDEHVLLLTAHHIVTDGWSMGVLVDELAAVYNGSALAPLNLQYPDFATWQRERGSDAALEHWVRQLSGIAPLEIPTDRPRPAVRTTRGATHEFTVPVEISSRLSGLARSADTTLFAGLVAVCQVLLARYAGQDDVAIGTVTSGRNRPEVTRMVGFFVNTVVLRSQVDDRLTFREFLDRVNDTVLDAFARDETPLDRLVDAVQRDRDPSRNPLFDVMVLLHNASPEPPRFTGLCTEPVSLTSESATFDLSWEFQEQDGRLSGALEYNTDLFDASTAERMACHLVALLAAVTDQPDHALGDVVLPTDVVAARGVRLDVPAMTYPQLFEDQAARTPDDTALVFRDVELTYAELNSRANRLAHHLITHGVGPEKLVALVLPRTHEMVIAFLAVLKAGGVYLPVDPTLPADRIRFLLEDADPVVVLDNIQHDDQPDTNPEVELRPDNSAYAIYTSGSTGTPKGVLVQHRNLVNLLVNHRNDFLADRGRLRVATTAVFSFDTSLEGPLLMADGHELHVIDDDTRRDADALVHYIGTHRIDFLNLTPSWLQQLIPAGLLDHRPQIILLGGEALPKNLWQELAASDTASYNFYGPTECTIDALSCRVTGTKTTIGTPLANLDAYILDDGLNPVPVGVPGQLHLAGDQLARGYLNRPGLTADRFTANPYGPPGSRMYATGDHARWLPDGSVDYLGRIDEQVKIRGFRIEPGEIETTLRQHQHITDAIVIARDNRLIAYTVHTAPVDCRTWLKPLLPDYMIPSAFVALDAMPLTPNGKIDRRALPEPELHRHSYTAPRNEVEETLAQIWGDVLGVERVGIEDNFFALGGDSILSIQVVSRARQASLHLTSKDIFLHQTIADLPTGVAASVEHRAISGPAPLTPIQRWFFEDSGIPGNFTMSVCVDLPENVDEDRLRRAVHAVVAHHEALRTRFRDGAQDVVPAEDADVFRATTIDIANGPLLRAALHDNRLTLVAHHLVIDSVSWRILIEDVEAAYTGRALPPTSTSFRQWAHLLAEHDFSADLPYWQSVDAPGDLPVDRTGPNTAGSTRTLSAKLGAEDTDALLHRVPDVYRTQINDVLLSALGRTLRDWTGRERVLIGVEGHGREEIIDGVDLTRTVGWFTSEYPLALTVPGDWATTIKSVKEQLRAVPHRGLSYGALRYLAGELRGTPQPRLSFNYHGQWDSGAQREDTGQDVAPESPRTYLIDVTGLVADGELELTWHYSDNVHDEQTVRRLAERMTVALREIVEHCAAPDSGGRTPSDFPLARLTQEQVDRIATPTVEDIYPLTPLQAGMLFHSLVDSDAYLNRACLRLSGVTDPHALGAALQRVVDRTPALRSVPVWDGVDRPLQVVHSHATVPVRYVDGDVPEDDDDIDLSSAPLMRATIVRVSADEVVLVWTTHHILFDGWSLGQVFEEICEQYAAIVRQRPPRLAARRPFREYLRWLDGQDHARAEAYWHGVLDDVAEPTPLPYDRPPAEAHRTESSESVKISVDATALNAMVKQHGLTVNTVVQGAWALLLSRYSSERDVVFGTTVSGRPADLPGVESMVGMFINTVPTRTRISGTVLEWLRELQVRQTEARQFDFVSLAQLQNGRKLFDSAVVFENYPFDEAATTEAGVRVTEVQALETTNFALGVRAHLADRLHIEVAYDPRLFDARTAEQLTRHLEVLLTGIVTTPDRPLDELPLLSGAERHRLLVEWNGSGSAHVEATIPELFAAQAARTPDAVAVTCEGRSLTYGELDARANRLAHRLIELGAGPERFVALMLPRSPDMVVAILGVLKSGAAYLPIDPDHPADRIAAMLADTAPVVVLSDVDGPGVDRQPATAPDVSAVPANPAYVIYTSGSTGRPKGVVIPHENVVRLFTSTRQWFGFDEHDVWTLFHSYAFDFSVWEIWGPLLHGGRLVVVPHEVSRSPRDFVRLLAEERVTVLNQTPSAFYQLQREDTSELDLRHVIFGGEALDLWRLSDWYAVHADNRPVLVNMYGITETTVHVSHLALDARSAAQATGSTIGVAIPDLRTYVLDGDLRLVPPGVTGELHVAGAGLARGYLHRPGLTADRFVANPFGAPGERMYRTGDLVRWREGRLEYLGRTDQQVKIRGFRVELGEIEAVLAAHPRVAHVAVIAREDQPGAKRLVAYVVGDDPDPAELRAFAATSLPDHMVPSAFVVLDELPLTRNGKLDRTALPAPEFTGGRVAPRTEAERQVAQVWSEVLDVDGVGAEDNFFSLGGDSIVSIRVASRLNVSPRLVFSFPTVAALAAAITANGAAPVSAIRSAPRGRALPLSFAQQRLWFLHDFEPDSTEYTTRFAVRLRGELDVDGLNRALTELVARHESLRTTFDSVDGQGVQVVHPPQEVRVPVVPDDDGVRPFDLSAGPLFRPRLVRLAADDHVFTADMHHIITDGWSLGVLVEELSALYNGCDLPPVELQYADYAVWQREELELADQLGYWTRQLASLPTLELPTDRSRPAVRTAAGAAHEFEVSAEVTAALKRLRADTTLFTTLVAACQLLFARYTGQDDIAVGTVVSGREHPQLERVVGFFVNTLVLRAHIDGRRGFTDFLGDVRGTVLDAFAHQDVPFERIVDEVQPERDTSRNPLFDVMVMLQNNQIRLPSLRGLDVTEQPLPTDTATCDITVEFQEHAGGLRGALEYNTDLFDATTMRRMATHLVALLGQIAAQPGRALADFTLPAELVAAQGVQLDVPTLTYPRWFERQAARTPDETALVFRDTRLTFAELNRRANRLAHHLVERGAGPEKIVALVLPRTHEMIIAFLAVLKAGAVYLPIDPGLPPDRVQLLLDDADPAVVLTNIDHDEQPDTNPATEVRPDNAAYAIYTSGSTGHPKGVLIDHRGLVNLLHNHRNGYLHGRGRLRMALTAVFSFDTSLEGLLAMADGHELHLIDEDTRLDADALVGYIGTHGIDVLDLTPSWLQQLIPAGLLTQQPRVLLLGGEALPENLWREVAANPAVDSYNLYGPTECTVDALSCRVTGSRPVIGTPLANLQACILDDSLNPVPVGVPGQLHLAGDQLARGYLNRPGLTADRFIANPYGLPGSRMYATGDRARWLPDGSVDYLGRADEQVKIRGFRIEPCEIETALRRHEDITDAVVVARTDNGHKRLVAYTVQTGSLDHRAWLKNTLPDYMIPSAFVVIDALPLTPSGKIDRRALPQPEVHQESTHTAPRTEAERVLAQIWSDVLGVEQVGVDDNFFALGGDSILSIQVVSRARQAGLKLTSKDIFLHQTIAELEITEAAPVEHRAVTGPAPLTPIQRWFFEDSGITGNFTMSVCAQLPPNVDADALRNAVQRVVAHHEALRTRFRDGQQDVVPVETAEIFRVTDESDVDPRAAIDIANGPVLQAVLFRRRGQLFLTAHHLVIDGVSWRILLDDLEAAYHGRSLTPTTTAFRDWAHQLAQHDFSADLPYWQAVGAPADLPVDRMGANTADSTRTISVELCASDTDALLHRVPDVYRTQINDVLLSALGGTLSRWTGDSRVLIGVEGHGREEIIDGVDLTRTVGWFTSEYPLALTISGDNWGSALKSVKEQLRAVPHRGMSFGALRYLAGELRDAPMPQISFNYHGQWEGGQDDGFYRGWHDPAGEDVDALSTRTCLIDVIGVVNDGRLELGWTYSANVHDESTVRDLAEQTMRCLREIVHHCAQPDAGGRTPSDFPLARLTQEQVDRITDRTVEDVYPLTPLQAGMLFHSLVDRDAYFNQLRLRLSGVADPEAFGRAWQRVVDRTPVLRTSLVWDGVDEPLQLVHQHVTLPVHHHDRPDDVDRIVAEDRAAGIDLTSAPLMRVTIIQLGGDEVLLIWTSHHVVLDGWSTGQVFADVCELYAAEVRGRRPALTNGRPFREYLAWLHRQDQRQAEEYWRGVLAGFEAPTPLPLDHRQVQAHQTESAESVRIELTAGESTRLNLMAGQNGLTVNTIIQGAWGLLLARHAGEQDVVFGTTVSGRPDDLPGVDSMVGMFINTVPTRVRAKDGEPLLPWLQELQLQQTESRRFDFVSLPQLRNWSDLPAGTPLFDTAVVFENYPLDEAAEDSDLRVTAVDAVDTTNFPLALSAYLDERLRFELAFDPALFDPSTARRLADRLRLLLVGMADDPRGTLGELPRMSERERRQVLEDWNRTELDVPDVTFPQVFEEQVARTPEATALVFRDTSFSYAELNAAANRLAHLLIRKGVGPERLVALELPRSAELVIAMLAVFKAGGVYLPVDPTLPQDRIEYLISDARPAVVVTHDLLTDAADEPDTDPVTAVCPGNSAYVIYTSGSTGKPKGVLVEHRNLVNLLFHHRNDLLKPCRRLRVALSAAFSFDTSLEGPVLMAAGNELHLIDDKVRLDPAALVGYVARHGIDFLDLTPSWAQQLVPAGLLDHAPLLMLGGEALSETLWRELAAAPATTSYNFYGPTECTIDALSCRVDDSATPVIGRPLHNLRAYVLDDGLRPVAVGVPGELHLAGAQVARGYLGRAGLTAERFIANPFGPPGTRMYATGDQVRWNTDGMIEYLGRTDEQVKIRGHRIEPGEIEAALLVHVNEAAVVARDDQLGITRLIAYLVGDELDPAQLRAALSKSLPEYMVPSAFMVLDRLPLTTNGKLDRRALPAPQFTGGHVAPRTETERVVARVWAGALGVERVGIEDNFFELGGDSILSIRVVSGLRAALGVELSPRELFTHPTVARMAAALPSGPTELDTIPAVPRDRALPLSHAQQRLWFLNEFEPGSTEYLAPSAVRLRGPLDIDALSDALTALVARHESLRTTFDSVDGLGVQVVHPPYDVRLPVIDGDLGRVLAEETTRPFDLRRGPLLRACLVRLDAEDHVLILVLHHIVTDGWSTGVLTSELGALYEGAELPPLAVQYADYAVWQREHLELADQLGYWTRQLAGTPPLELPADRPRPAVRTSAGAVHEFAVPADVTTALKELGQRHDSTLFMTLLAACQLLFARYAGQDDVAVGTVTSGRERAELAGLIGFFVNTLVLRSTVDHTLTGEDFLGRVRATALEAFARQDVPFERVVDELRLDRDTSRNPLFDVMVLLQNVPTDAATLGVLEIEDVELPVSTATCDITVEFQEHEGVLAGAFEYSTDLFDAVTIERMAEHLVTLLGSLAAHPDRTLAELSLPTDLVAAHGVALNVPATTYPQLFEEQAARTPDEIALVFRDTRFTYAELNTRANRLAHHLITHGVGPEKLVALVLPRTHEMVIAFLAVLKAGGIYLPVDPTLPADRIRFLLKDADPVVVLHNIQHDDQPDTNPEVELRPDNTAYAIYTSGSTGTPKGVLVQHRNLVNLLANHRNDFLADRGRLRVATTAVFSFDTSLEGPLLMADGHELHIIDDDTRRDADALVHYIGTHRIDFLNLTPSWLQQLIPAGLLDHRPQIILLGGEALPKNLWQELAASDTASYNFYGPTECTIDALSCRVTGTKTTIGTPLANLDAYILDDGLNPVPVGVPGQLHLAGDQLARGYLNRPGLTADRFTANPYGPPGSRMYATGDHARWTRDGSVDYLGRIDEQVKIRGFRIEPGEIETALRQHQHITDAIVIARDNRLIAYTVQTDSVEHRAWLKNTLPDYMIPSAFVALDAMPLTPNGKIDRRALPEPELHRHSYTAPRNEIEEQLTQVWSDVLGVERVGIDDNFFELGGDSILSIQVTARARRAGLRVSTKDLFVHQTIAALAPVVTLDDTSGADLGPVAGDAPLTPIQRWFFDTHHVSPHHFNQSMLVELTGDLDVEALRTSLDALLAHHDALRMRFQRCDEGWRQHNAPIEQHDVLERRDLSDVDAADRWAAMEKIADDVHASFDLTTGPLLKAVLFTGGTQHLFLTAHHLVVDGVSWRILLEDLETAHGQAVRGVPIDLGPKTTSFRDWATKLTEHVARGALDHELDHWSQALRGCTLPVDHPRPQPGTPGESVPVQLSADDTEALLRHAPAAYRTRINDVLLTALAWSLSRWTGHRTVSVDLEGHGREDVLDGVDVSRTVGWFTTVFPVAVDVPDQAGWRDLVKSVRRQLRTVPGNGFGFGALRHLGRKLPAGQEPQVAFNYLGQWDEGAEDGLLGTVHGSIGQDADPANRGSHLLEIVGSVESGQLGFSWYFQPDVHDRSTVERVARDFADALCAIAQDCRARRREGSG
ncbi:amino acid adenylation domain-containing protein [Lentzea tibetensis]|uniref:Amino acid adenylation domain-containing protein n=1 Tax=Lentzea tibetensis TaxID=2591470 RepID=A0A563F4P3_9PSEU|nr:non-ribosomal peptide synthase/polyketide synthase [Lentzea tibetensis]TWP54344.1 amino acid adenylation domain-containing protein [Lentzea tibetensis]